MALTAAQCTRSDPLHPWNAYRAITAKTADYTLVQDDFGKLFTNKGDADAIVFTLPTPSSVWLNKWVDFYIVADFEVSVTCATSDRIVAHNNASADTITFTQAGEHMGNWMRFVCDGALWYCIVGLASEAVTNTITDA